MDRLPELSSLSHADKDALIHALLAQVQVLTARVAELEAKLGGPPKTPDNSSMPPSQGKKANRGDQPARSGPRQGSLGRKGGGRRLCEAPDETVTARPCCCAQCAAPLTEADLMLAARFDKIDLPKVVPVVTRVEHYAGHCRGCGATTLAPLPEGLEPGTPFSLNIVALAMYLRFAHHVSYRRLTRLMLDLFGLAISEGALDAALRRAKPGFDAETAAILARLRRSRVVGSDETGVRVDGRTGWNWVFQNTEVVIHVIRHSRGAGVVREVMSGHRPAIWVSDLYSAQRGHAAAWQICLAHQLRDCRYAIEAGDTVFAPRMKALLLRAVVLARRHRSLAESTRRQYRRRLERDLDAIMALAPTQRHGQRLRKRYGLLREHLFTFLDDPEVSADNNTSERDLRHTATYRKVTGGFRSTWGANLFAAVRSVIGTAARRGIDAYQAIRAILQGQSVLAPG
ncbi:IS66 family transposase [Paracraurococcus lichenis]|uniref:IS66 family transposase n=1 Tax=Paracraurococcus lichenis TaxID=3064888 RepID=A0ABT9EDI3_9PROT|nr:IS66 family transposase [Paracraurococcus sp. LOR1-02]MDO9714162.1 IS66 family transposase [Paracraurococcus sp. LOR1-02]